MDTILRDVAKHEGSDEILQERPRDYVVSGDITPAHLKQLVELGVEASISDLDDGRRVLGIGTEEGPYHIIDELTHERLLKSRLSFHTHPDKNDVVFDAPSESDLFVTAERGDLPPIVVAHSRGMLLCIVDEHAIEELSKRTPRPVESSPEDNNSDALREYVAQQRDFASKIGATVFEASWDDPIRIAEIMRLFQRT